MTAKNYILEHLAGIEDDNTPTYEWQNKSQFSVKNGVWQTRTIAQRLYAGDRISQEVYDSCQKWTESFILLHDGPGALQNSRSTLTIKHDKISWTMEQAKRSDSIAAVRSFLGKPLDNILIMTLYYCHSANFIASKIGTEKYSNSALCKYIDEICINSYEKLNEFYLLNL